MRNKFIAAVAAAMLAAVAVPAVAAERPLSYTWFEAGYAQTEVDGLDQVLGSDHLDGYDVNISYGHDNGLILFGSYGSTGKDLRYSDADIDARGDLDFDRFRVGIGYAFGINERVDWVTRAAYENAKLGLSGSVDYLDEFGDPATGTLAGEIEAKGYSLETGLRGKLASRFEGYIGGGYVRSNDPTVSDIHIDGEVYEGGTIDLDGLGVDRSETYGAVGLKFDIAGSWSIVGRAMLTSDVNVYFVGLRSSLY
jgi:hypothetical protein